MILRREVPKPLPSPRKVSMKDPHESISIRPAKSHEACCVIAGFIVT